MSSYTTSYKKSNPGNLVEYLNSLNDRNISIKKPSNSNETGITSINDRNRITNEIICTKKFELLKTDIKNSWNRERTKLKYKWQLDMKHKLEEHMDHLERLIECKNEKMHDLENGIEISTWDKSDLSEKDLENYYPQIFSRNTEFF